MPPLPFVFLTIRVEWSIMIVLYPITGLVAGAVVWRKHHVFHRDVLSRWRTGSSASLCFTPSPRFSTPSLRHQARFQHRDYSECNVGMAGFGFIYSLYMLLLLVEVWLVFRPTINAPGRGLASPGSCIGCCPLVAGKSPTAHEPQTHGLSALAIAGIPLRRGCSCRRISVRRQDNLVVPALMPVIFLASAVASA
jgi:hypothetical protein